MIEPKQTSAQEGATVLYEEQIWREETIFATTKSLDHKHKITSSCLICKIRTKDKMPKTSLMQQLRSHSVTRRTERFRVIEDKNSMNGMDGEIEDEHAELRVDQSRVRESYSHRSSVCEYRGTKQLLSEWSGNIALRRFRSLRSNGEGTMLLWKRRLARTPERDEFRKEKPPIGTDPNMRETLFNRPNAVFRRTGGNVRAGVTGDKDLNTGTWLWQRQGEQTYRRLDSPAKRLSTLSTPMDFELWKLPRKNRAKKNELIEETVDNLSHAAQ
ncbi:hypothetical protein K438DRAFT_1781596 [Mycena galopus ATCC 62051]|nr:hypothetical protein K438DRAFT_1781596 [Mycena galopus ATCC 62051]